jgi:C-terminal processing protease CtpA/Prc
MRRGKVLKLVAYLFIFVLVLTFTGCSYKKSTEGTIGGEIPEEEKSTKVNFSVTEVSDLQTKNLHKLCKVWGYVKYNHPVFLLGEKDWDEELLNLIPIVYNSESEEQVNDILYKWFVELGDIDYGTLNIDTEWELAMEKDKVVQADTSWIEDESYLGVSLSDSLLQLKAIPTVNRRNAPVYFVSVGMPMFKNEKSYEDMNYMDTDYRLLGLFRFWNAIEYYYPYLDIMDDDWSELLFSFIPKMVEGTDKQSYKLTLAEIGTYLHDAHVCFRDRDYIFNEFGKYAAPVGLTQVNGELVVYYIGEEYKDSCQLTSGDILVKLNGKDINDRIDEVKKYCSYPTDEKILFWISPLILRSDNKTMEITVLRDNEEMVLNVEGVEGYFNSWIDSSSSHELLENNIGLINPSKLSYDEIPEIMEEFADTNGIIVDLRQYPSDISIHDLPRYLSKESRAFAVFSKPSKAVPGTFLKGKSEISGGQLGTFFYKNKVVVLMDETSMSQQEFVIMSLRNGENVTVMGENSIGADGNVTLLPLPGGNRVQFTSLGVYTQEGGQTQRIGLAPDIYVEKTIEGIKEGRDEYIEEAIKYILGEK